MTRLQQAKYELIELRLAQRELEGKLNSMKQKETLLLMGIEEIEEPGVAQKKRAKEIRIAKKGEARRKKQKKKKKTEEEEGDDETGKIGSNIGDEYDDDDDFLGDDDDNGVGNVGSNIDGDDDEDYDNALHWEKTGVRFIPLRLQSGDAILNEIRKLIKYYEKHFGPYPPPSGKAPKRGATKKTNEKLDNGKGRTLKKAVAF